jgi:polyhydroxyalkanoate synthesis regulator phasin
VKLKSLMMTLVTLAALLFASIASAQDATVEPRGARRELAREVIELVASELGLTPEALLMQLRDGSTAAEVIIANGGDVQAVTDAVVELITTRVNEAVASGEITQERADRLLANLEQRVTQVINGELRGERGQRARAAVNLARTTVQTAAEQLGIEPQALIQQMRQNDATLAETIVANSGDVQAVTDAVIAEATTRINEAVDNGELTQEQADALLEALPTTLDAILNGQLPERGEGRRGDMRLNLARGVVQLAAEQTGLTEQEIVEQLHAGSTLAEILTANGVDTAAFIDAVVVQAQTRLDQAVADGRITQERADALLEQVRQQLTERINTPLSAGA